MAGDGVQAVEGAVRKIRELRPGRLILVAMTTHTVAAAAFEDLVDALAEISDTAAIGFS